MSVRTHVVLAVVLVIVVACSMAGLVWPNVSRVRVLDVEIEHLRRDLSRPMMGPEEVERLAYRINELKRQGEARMTPIPAESDVAGLMTSLSETLDGLGLPSREMTTGQPQELAEASSLPMSVVVSGPFPSIYRVVRHVEALPRLVRVQRLRVTSPRAEQGSVDRSGAVRADLMIEVFYSPREVSAAGE